MADEDMDRAEAHAGYGRCTANDVPDNMVGGVNSIDQGVVSRCRHGLGIQSGDQSMLVFLRPHSTSALGRTVNPSRHQGASLAHFAPRLREALAARGWSGKLLASAVGVSQNTVSNWVAGRHVPTHAHLVAIAECLEVDLETLTGGTAGEVAQDPLVARLLDLGIEDGLRRLAEATPDLLRVLDEARARART